MGLLVPNQESPGQARTSGPPWVEEHNVGSEVWTQILILPLSSCVTVDKSQKLSEPQFSHL